MTVIAWDGETLAADKRMSRGCHVSTVTKIFAVGEYLIGFTGSAKRMGEFRVWLGMGAIPADYPPAPDDDPVHALAVRCDRTIWSFEGTPYPVQIEDKIAAAGSGRDYALATMHLGFPATKAVEIACLFDENCGNGIDVLTLADLP